MRRPPWWIILAWMASGCHVHLITIQYRDDPQGEKSVTLEGFHPSSRPALIVEVPDERVEGH